MRSSRIGLTQAERNRSVASLDRVAVSDVAAQDVIRVVDRADDQDVPPHV
jgi:hypothetical protein